MDALKKVLGMKDTDKVSGNMAGEDIGAPIGLGTAGDTGTTGSLGGDITADVNMPENRELGGYTKVKENSIGDTVVVKKDLLGRTVEKKVVDPADPLVQKADQTIKDVAHRLETTNPVVLDKNVVKKTKEVGAPAPSSAEAALLHTDDF
eukprot:TRINITY_DN108_c0_g1_i1.p1 TRINITY_DN108_c0_g1~~TRINITY_DN108_c0_g1_i1.p1  ORF type:complete len:156 (+),score=46.52 TRINITY_DN108_c0_g1_i1:23-469(+)